MARRTTALAVSLALAACALPACASASEDRLPAGVDAPPGVLPDADTPSPDAPPSACDLALQRLATGFESGAAGWSHVVLDGAQADWPLDEWQLGAATSGPGSCHGGGNCWATRLDANYTSCQRAALVSPPLDLSACAGQNVELGFYSWHDFWTGVVSGSSTTWFDGGLVEMSTDGNSWTQVTPATAYPGTIDINPKIGQYECVQSNAFHVDGKRGFVGNGASWTRVAIPIPSTLIGATFRVRFAYASGVSHPDNDPEVDRMYTRAGWYIDDLDFVVR